MHTNLSQVTVGYERLIQIYPALGNLQHPEWWAILNRSVTVNIPANTALFKEFNAAEHLVFILRGHVRTYQINQDGRELTLYRCQAGQICAQNVQQLLTSEQAYDTRSVTETIVQTLVISSADFHRLMSLSVEFRDLVLQTLTLQFTQLEHQLYEQTFHTLDERLCDFLKNEFSKTANNFVHITHQQLASELGTTREVVSRSLKQLEKRGCLRLFRGKIELLSSDALAS